MCLFSIVCYKTVKEYRYKNHSIFLFYVHGMSWLSKNKYMWDLMSHIINHISLLHILRFSTLYQRV